MKAIETEYGGYLFRSRLEARWAMYLDALGIRWEYEPEGLVLSDGTHYLPDFYLIDFHCYFEVKRKGIKGTDEGDTAIRKISDGKKTNEWAGIICFGDPLDNDLTIFCQETDDGGGGSYESKVAFGVHPETYEAYLLSYKDRRDRTFYDSFGDEMQVIPMTTTEYGTYKFEDFVNPYVIDLMRYARQARFEHGETPRRLISC